MFSREKFPNHRERKECSLLIKLFLLILLTPVNVAQFFNNERDLLLSSSIVQEGLEFCEAEVFTTDCLADYVVVVTEAKYGRMQLGRCVEKSYGSIGCAADVLSHLDTLCSGRRKCELRIPDKSLDDSKPCPPDLKTYLNVSYKCLEVESAACSMCRQGSEDYAHVTSQYGYLGSIVSSETHYDQFCGSAKCPWKIEVLLGQTINITLFDFAMGHRSLDKSLQSGENCYRYAVIKERSRMKDAAVCGSRGRTQFVYHSVSNSIEIHVVSSEVFSRLGQFVLKYEAIGCPDLKPPNANTKFKRVKDYMEISCSDGQNWKVVCKNNKWSNDAGVCTESLIESSFNSYIGPLSIAIIVGIALVIAVLIVTIGIVCLQKQHIAEHDTSLYYHPGQCYEYRGRFGSSLFYDDAGCLPNRKDSADQKSIYGHVTELEMGRQNFYDVPRSAEKRPLPLLPGIKSNLIKKKALEARVDSDAKSQKYQSVITCPRFGPADGGSTRCQTSKQVLQHYTVLEPTNILDLKSETYNSQINEEISISDDVEMLTWATPDPCSIAYFQASSQAGSEETNPESLGNKEEIKDDSEQDLSSDKIPLRPIREGSQKAVAISNLKLNSTATVPGVTSLKSATKLDFIGNKSWP